MQLADPGRSRPHDGRRPNWRMTHRRRRPSRRRSRKGIFERQEPDRVHEPGFEPGGRDAASPASRAFPLARAVRGRRFPDPSEACVGSSTVGGLSGTGVGWEVRVVNESAVSFGWLARSLELPPFARGGVGHDAWESARDGMRVPVDQSIVSAAGWDSDPWLV
jgi:hypothetical protein